MAGRIDWHRLKPVTVAIELGHVALGLAALWTGWLSFPLLVLAAITELLVTGVLSALIFHERGAGRHVADVLKMLGLCLFLSVFLVASYVGADGFRHGPVFESRGFAVLAGLIAVRLSLVAWLARRSADPRLRWTREAILRGGVVLVALLFGAFACFLPGVLLAGLLAPQQPAIAADVALGGVFLLLQAGLACLMSTMSEHELAGIARNPYID